MGNVTPLSAGSSSSTSPRAVPLACSPDVVADLMRVLTNALAHTGSPTWWVLYDADAPAPCRSHLIEGAPAEAPSHAVVVATSGSTGHAKRSVLGVDALRASATMTHSALGGHGQWVLPLPTQHVAGWQVLTRSVLARTVPVVLKEWSVDAFSAACQQLSHERRYTSVVPAQLHDLVRCSEGRAALRSFSAVLVGGGPTPRELVEDLRGEGVRLVRTYGSSETAGGCVYERTPLPGVRLALEDDGRICLGGTHVAHGYVTASEDGQLVWDDPLTASAFALRDGTRTFRTDDVGEVHPTEDAAEPALTVLGRKDDVIISGGVKVWPTAVEAALHRHWPHVTAVVVGVPDARWGQRVTAVVEQPPQTLLVPTLEEVRAQLRSDPAVHEAALPRALHAVARLATLPSGKPDRRRIAEGLIPQNHTGPETALS